VVEPDIDSWWSNQTLTVALERTLWLRTSLARRVARPAPCACVQAESPNAEEARESGHQFWESGAFGLHETDALRPDTNHIAPKPVRELC
jgi:hypothetical protein